MLLGPYQPVLIGSGARLSRTAVAAEGLLRAGVAASGMLASGHRILDPKVSRYLSSVSAASPLPQCTATAKVLNSERRRNLRGFVVVGRQLNDGSEVC